jgi:hypothetical protein
MVTGRTVGNGAAATAALKSGKRGACEAVELCHFTLLSFEAGFLFSLRQGSSSASGLLLLKSEAPCTYFSPINHTQRTSVRQFRFGLFWQEICPLGRPDRLCEGCGALQNHF